MNNSATQKQIFLAIEQAKNILIVPHKDPDPDTLGAALALHEHITSCSKQARIFNLTGASKKFHFLPHYNQISSDPVVWEDTSIDLIIVLDSGDLDYAGILPMMETITFRPQIVNIDHHKTNAFFGDINLVNLESSSTSEILYFLFRHNRVSITPTMATNLIAGIMYDTDNFTNAATKYTSLFATSDLVKHGGRFHFIKEHLYRDKSVDILKLWGEILGRLQHNTKHDIVYTFITLRDLNHHSVSEDDLRGFSNFLSNIKEGSGAIFFKEKPDGNIRVSMRTTYDHIDMSAIAEHFGGGGHKKACGFELEGPIDTAFERFFIELDTHPIPWRLS
ncbi:bifunctional oligoribonuclease/PAP phosphatase NrnA [Candidatus Nomurabacteria bacterium]|nr:bifunctional oligoribonuclease/PAP phosphatase NrnA [Candidatus Nomurabacteria bacterium]